MRSDATRYVPVHKAFALQVGQRCAELVGKQDEGGQVQAVLPHLQERAQLRGARRRTDERREGGRIFFLLEWQEVTLTPLSPAPDSYVPLPACRAP